MLTMNPDASGRLLRVLPGVLLRPLGFLPRSISNQAIIACCNQLFAAALVSGELAFLDQRVLKITAEDAGIDLIMSGNGAYLCAANSSNPPDVSIRGSAYDLLLLISRREDADTLFFQRRLRVEGDTELGLHLKNFLDAWEPPVVVQWLQKQANGWLALAERYATAESKAMQTPSTHPQRSR